MRRSRTEEHELARKPPTQRGAKSARRIARAGQETGVTSRARKSVQGHESAPDPRYGGRPGRAKSKWYTRGRKAARTERG